MIWRNTLLAVNLSRLRGNEYASWGGANKRSRIPGHNAYMCADSIRGKASPMLLLSAAKKKKRKTLPLSLDKVGTDH